MKFVLPLIIAYTLLSCSNESKPKSELLGVWISDKEKTLTSIEGGNSIPDDMKYYLDKNLGKMAYIFNEGGTNFIPVDSLNEINELFNWDVVENTKSAVTIKLHQSWITDVDVHFIKENNCLGIQNNAYNYIEYFCKAK